MKNLFCISIIVPLNEDCRIWLHIKNLTLESMSNNRITIFEEAHPVSQFQNNTVLKIPSGLYVQMILLIHFITLDYILNVNTHVHMWYVELFVMVT